jgi:hypothetical protein
MADIEFRLRRSEDELEPYYVRIAEAGDGQALAFSENDADPAAGDRAVELLRAGDVEQDTLFDKGNDVWFFRFRTAGGDVLFRSLPCADEAAMHATIARIRDQAPAAEVVDDRGEPT